MAPKGIASPVPISWYPTLSVLMLAIGLVISASFFIYEATSSRRNRSLAMELYRSCGIHLPGFWVIVLTPLLWHLRLILCSVAFAQLAFCAR